MITEKVKDAIKQLSLKEPDREVCGFIVVKDNRQIVVQCPNVSADPVNSFSIDPVDYLNVSVSAKILKVFHSHIKSSQNKPTYPDLVVVGGHKIASVIYNVPLNRFIYTDTDVSFPSLLGRTFKFGVADCLTLVTDFYKSNYNIDFTHVLDSRTVENLDPNLFNEDYIFDLFHKNGFKECQYRQFGDCIVMKFPSTNLPVHLAIYVGNELILHQPMHQPSKFDDYSNVFKDATLKIFRYE